MTRTRRSSRGCWTCRLRKKKCDETYPQCQICAGLRITCHYSRNKPAWMGNSQQQSEMYMRIKREVKDNALSRPRNAGTSLYDGKDGPDRSSVEHSSNPQAYNDTNEIAYALGQDRVDGPSASHLSDTITRVTPTMDTSGSRWLEKGVQGVTGGMFTTNRTEMIILSWFLDFVLPFVFPGYEPSMLTGGKSWIMEMVGQSSMLRQIAQTQSSYLFAAMHRPLELGKMQSKIQQMDKGVLASAIVMTQSLALKSAQDRIQNGLAVLLSILLVQHFETYTFVFDNCRDNLNVALRVYELLLVGPVTEASMRASFTIQDLVSLVNPPATILPELYVEIYSAEEAASNFTISLLIFDDIIASTLIGTSPSLRKQHQHFLCESNLDLEPVIGCSSFIMFQISSIAELAEHKNNCRRSGTLDIIELMRQVLRIKDTLEQTLGILEHALTSHNLQGDSCRETYIRDRDVNSATNAIWTHAALLYLHVLANGLQYAHFEVQKHVTVVLDLLNDNKHRPGLLHRTAWPICVAGCLASGAQQGRFTTLLDSSTPNLPGTVRKAGELIRVAWSKRSASGVDQDFASIFEGQIHLPLLV